MRVCVRVLIVCSAEYSDCYEDINFVRVIFSCVWTTVSMCINLFCVTGEVK